jgi:Preprotein translocase subunit YidC
MLVLLSWIYDLLIAPLAIAYGGAYYVCSRILGFGYGLLALSLLTTLILAPLRKKVAAAQDAERLLNTVIKPQLARIKAESSGEERHQRIRRLYKRYSYHPIMSIRAMWGLLLQVPFILAAYHMLSELTALRMVSFWGVDSLAKADALLPGGINLFPLLMTVFNIAAALLTPNATRKETAQAFVIAALFLVLLYAAPSALLIYWTSNNLLSLASVLYERYRPKALLPDEDVVREMAGANAVGGESDKATAAVSAGRIALYALACISLPVVWGFFLVWRRGEMLSGQSPYYFTFSSLDLALAAALIVGAAVGVGRIRNRFRNREMGIAWQIIGVVFSVCLALFILYGWAFSIEKKSVSGKLFIWTTLGYVFAAALAWFMVTGKLNSGLLQRLKNMAGRYGQMLYWPAVFAFACLLTLFAPLASYQTAPEIFNFPPLEALRRLLPYFLCLIYFFLYLRVVLSRPNSSRLGLLMAFVCLVGLVAALAFPPVGILEANIIQAENVNTQWTAPVQDVLTLAIALGIMMLFAWRRKMQYLAHGLAICGLALFLFGLYAVATTPYASRSESPVASASGIANAAAQPSDNTQFPPYHRQLFALSPDQPNVLVFMFDMFHGGHVGEMLADDPVMAERLPGFVWYKDMISDGNNTLLSFPALMGGPDYTAQAINSRRDGRLADKVLASTLELPRRFVNAGYDVTCFNVRGNLAVFGGKTLAEMIGVSEDRVRDMPVPDSYVNLTREIMNPEGIGEQTDHIKNLLAISLFRVVPNLSRGRLVDWGLFTPDSIGDDLYEDSVIPVLMPRFMTADSPVPTYKMFATTFCHNPFFLGPDSLLPVSKRDFLALAKTDAGHYYTDRHAIRLMAVLFDRLRELGVYDNTRIILVSDHDYKNDPHPYLEGNINYLLYAPKPYALLMVKDFNASGPLVVSDRLMQGHDVPALACSELGEIGDPPSMPPDDPERVRKHTIAKANIAHHSEEYFIDLSAYTIKGTMFDPKNWSEAEEETGEK